MDPYLTAKWLHILSSTVLFGTGIGTAFQMVWAMRGNDPRVIARVSSGVVLADWIFTTPAGLAQPATGIWLIWQAGHDPWSGWLVAAYVLYLLAFACWAPVVRLQIRIRDLARIAATANRPLPVEARRAYRIWFALGWPAFAALIAIFWLMVVKP
ncbi:DUF2269 domain-containing protein [Seohaeicola saemankumensis]|nr:DUF2269 domain-containing protein [Seohaeicola saemankumensis]MCA0870942.1 DUF2269 domain-containing protein [Seohaeicola saemankumensis]